MWVSGSGDFYWWCSVKMCDTKLLIINVIVVIKLFDLVDSLQSMGPNSLMFVRNLLDKLGSNQQNILKFIACNEIFLMPATVFMLFRYSFSAWILWDLNLWQLNSFWFPFLQLGQSFSFIRRTAFITFIVNVFWHTNHLETSPLQTYYQDWMYYSLFILLYWQFHIFFLFSGQGSLLLPFIYYRFLTLRYTSRRNPYCR